MPTREGVSAWPTDPKVFDNALKHPQRHRPWHIIRIPIPDTPLCSDCGKAARGCPFNGFIRFGKMPRAGSDDQRIETLVAAQLRTQSGSLETDVTVRGIKHGFDAGSGNNPGQIASAPAEQRTKQTALLLSGQRRTGSHGRKTANASSA